MHSPLASETSGTPVALRILRLLGRVPMVWALIALVIVTALLYKNFFTAANLTNMFQQTAPLALVSIGMTYVIIAGGFDLSVGAAFAAGAIFFASFDGVFPMPIGLLLTLLVGLAAGTLNGILVARFKINAFVATLGTSSVIYGIVTLYAGNGAKFLTSGEYTFLKGNVAGIPISVIMTTIIFVIAGVVLARSTFGRSVYAVGGNYEAARLNGVRVRLVAGLTFVIAGGLSALGGVVLVSQIGTAQSNFGATMALDAIAVVIIGGTSLTGGEGAIWRTVVGVLILTVINNLFSALTLEPALQGIIKGAIVIVAVGFDRWSRSRRSS